MLKHHITKYSSGGKRFATSWIQLNLLNKSYCFNIKEIEI